MRNTRQAGSMSRGFTLVELMITVAIVAILASVALPGYRNQVRKTHRADAEGAITQDANFLERYFTENNCYKSKGADNLCGTADDSNPTLPITDYPTNNPRYTLSATIANDGMSYTVQAAPKSGTDQVNDPCGTLSYTSAGVKSASQANCW